MLTPIQPVTQEDDRPAICDLIEKHLHDINAVRKLIVNDPLFDSTLYDDLWILRFIMSHKNRGKAAKAAKKAMQIREEYKLNELGDIRSAFWPRLEDDSLPKCMGDFHRHCEVGSVFHDFPHPDRGLVTYMRLAGMHFKALARDLTEETNRLTHIYFTEWCFQVVDKLTRRTGRLTKVLKLVDLQGMRFNHLNRVYLKRDSEASKISNDCYPQLLGAVILCNLPWWIVFLSNIVRPLFPRRMVEKVVFISSPKQLLDPRKVLRYISLSDIPERVGGNHIDWPPRYVSTKGNVS